MMRSNRWKVCGLAWWFGFLLIVCLLVGEQVKAEQGAESLETASENSNRDELDRRGKADADPLTLAGRVLDESGEPVAGTIVYVESEFAEINASDLSNDDGRFKLDVRIDPNALRTLRVSAASSDRSKLGFVRQQQTAVPSEMSEMEIRLEAIKTARVQVLDEQGRPIEVANVMLQHGYPFTSGPAQSNSQGMVDFSIPQSESIVSAVAWKSGAGLDYQLYTLPREQSRDRLAQIPEFPIESLETLTLSGASPLSLRVSDTENHPLSDVRGDVWLLRNETQNDQINLSYFGSSLRERTDDDGRIQLDWFPTWHTEPVTVWLDAEGFVRTRIDYDPTSQSGMVEAQLQRTVPIHGIVTFPDGTPAPNIQVTAIGAGFFLDDHREVTETDEAGHYEIMAAPNHIYLLYVTDNQWGAPFQSGFAVLPGQEVPERNFQLAPAARVFGKVINQKTGDPIPGTQVYLTFRGTPLHEIGEDILPNPENRWVCPIGSQGLESREDGSFEFFLGEGEFVLGVSGQASESFSISNEREMRFDLPITLETKSVLTGTAVDVETNEPVSGVVLQGISRNFRRHNDWRAETAADGRFEIERYSVPSVVHAVDLGRELGAIVEVEEDQPTLEVKLAKLGSAQGRLLTTDGSKAAAGVKLSYGVRVWDVGYQSSSTRFGKQITTDAKGEFVLPEIVPGHEYECYLTDYPDGYYLVVSTFTIEPGESKELGDVKTPETPKPYVPPTLAERTTRAFSVQGTPLERFEKAIKLIEELNMSLLIIFAEPTSPLTESLMKIRFEDSGFGPYESDFRFMAIPTDRERLADARALATRLELPEPIEENGFWMVVVNRPGRVLAVWNADRVSSNGNQISKERWFQELDEFRTAPLDAHELLEEALATAKREGKRVLIQETATWCGPCHMLSRLLQENRQWEKDIVWVKMDHRWTGAIDIMKEFRDGAEGGIPWFVILDEDGQKLATSNLPETGQNIGFPSSEKGQEHFANMLRSTRQRMTDEEITDLARAASSQE